MNVEEIQVAVKEEFDRQKKDYAEWKAKKQEERREFERKLFKEQEKYEFNLNKLSQFLSGKPVKKKKGEDVKTEEKVDGNERVDG